MSVELRRPSIRRKLWPLISAALIAPMVLPVVLGSRIAGSFSSSPNLVKKTGLLGLSPVVEYLFCFCAILMQENGLLSVPREFTSAGDTGESDSLSMTVSSLILLGTGGYCLAHGAKVWRGMLRNLPLFALPLFNILSTAWSIEPALTLKRGILALSVSMFWLFIAVRLTLRQTLTLLSQTIIFGAWGSLIFSLAFPQLGRDVLAGMNGEWHGIYTQKNVLGYVMATGISILLFRILLLKRLTVSGVITICLCIALIGLSKSSTSLTSSLIGFLGCATYLLIIRGSDGRLLVVGLALAGVLTAIMMAIVEPDFPFALLGKDSTLTGRTELWEYVMELIHERPLLGWGYKAMWTPDTIQTTYIWNQTQWEAPQAHNGYLETALSLGQVGCLMLGITAFAMAQRVVRCFANGEKLLGAMLSVVLVQQVTANFTESLFNDTSAIGWDLLTFLGLYAGYAVQPKHSGGPHPILAPTRDGQLS